MNLTAPRTFPTVPPRDVRESRPELEIRREERRRIGRELHDSTSQLLVAIQLNLAMLKQNSENDETRLLFSVLDSTLQELHCEVRAVASAPPLLVENLPAALQTMTAKFGLLTNIDIKVDVQGRYVPRAPDVVTAVYRIAQEALANVARHAQARSVKLRLSCRKTWLKLTIDDDGVGFATGENSVEPDWGTGLDNIRDRVAELKGRLNFERLPRGSRLSVTIDCPPASTATA